MRNARLSTSRSLTSPHTSPHLTIISIPPSFTKDGVNELVFVENQFKQKFSAAVANGDASEPFLDYSTIFYTTQLDSYVKALSADGVKFLPVAWKDDQGSAHYSIIVHACSQIILELVSNSKPSSADIAWVSADVGGFKRSESQPYNRERMRHSQRPRSCAPVTALQTYT